MTQGSHPSPFRGLVGHTSLNLVFPKIMNSWLLPTQEKTHRLSTVDMRLNRVSIQPLQGTSVLWGDGFLRTTPCNYRKRGRISKNNRDKCLYDQLLWVCPLVSRDITEATQPSCCPPIIEKKHVVACCMYYAHGAFFPTIPVNLWTAFVLVCSTVAFCQLYNYQ